MSISKDSTLRLQNELAHYMAVEGRPFYGGTSWDGVTQSVNLQLGQITAPGYDRALLIDTIEVGNTGTGDVDLAITLPDLNYADYTTAHRVTLKSHTSMVIPLSSLLRASDLHRGSAGISTIYVKSALDPTAGATSGYVNITGKQMYDDLNFKADKIMLWIGDSITADGTGLTDHRQGYDSIIRKYLRDGGLNLRMVNMSASGTTSTDHDMFIRQGKYNIPQIDLIVCPLGVNNVAVGNAYSKTVTTVSGSTTVTGLFSANEDGGKFTSTTGITNGTSITRVNNTSATLSAAATASGNPVGTFTVDPLKSYAADIAALIAWKQNKYPNAKLLILGATPLSNSGNETVLATIRTAGASAVTAAADPKIFYHSLATVFDRTNAANYAGDGVHPNASFGVHQALADDIWSFMTANGLNAL